MTDTACSLSFCDAVATCRGLCAAHYQRQRHGQPLVPIERRATHRAGTPCPAPDCGRTAVKRGLCGSHYRQVQRGGVLRPLSWSTDAPRLCVICGAQDWAPNGYQRACSGRCAAVLAYHGGTPPAHVKVCAHCGVIFDLRGIGKNGRKKKSDTVNCDLCRYRHRRHKMSVSVLAQRDGTDCGICGETVDLTLKTPSVWRPSVDHILPWATGGTHDPANLQLAHLWCNQVKHAKAEFSLRIGA